MRIINADCLPEMKNMPDKSFDLAIVDPPYGVFTINGSRHGGRGAGKLKNRFMNKNADRFRGWDNPPGEEYFKELFRVSKNQIIWGGNYFSLGRTRGFIVWDKKQPWKNFSQAEYAWTSFDMPSRIVSISSKIRGRVHETQKPVELYRWLLRNYAKKGDKILDTHLGSGTHAVACFELGFDLTAFEIKKEYYEIALSMVKNLEIQTELDL